MPVCKLTGIVVLAADGVRGTRRAFQTGYLVETSGKHVPGIARADADNVDRGAGKADHGIRILHRHTKPREDLRDSGVAGLLNAFAALERSSAAGFRARASAGCRGGNSKDYEGGDGEELGEHSVQ